MIRLTIAKSQRQGDGADLTPDQWHYLTHVMRLREGSRIEVLIESQGLFEARLKGAMRLILDRALPLPPGAPITVTVFQALLKQDRFAEVVERGTEVGIRRFVPIVTERTIVREVAPKRLERWRAIAAEAAEQSRQPAVPVVDPPQKLRDLRPDGLGLCLHPGARSLYEIWQEAQGTGTAFGAVQLIVGPEGGLTASETAFLQQAGFYVGSLGPRIYRAENAGVFAALLLMDWASRLPPA